MKTNLVVTAAAMLGLSHAGIRVKESFIPKKSPGVRANDRSMKVVERDFNRTVLEDHYGQQYSQDNKGTIRKI